MVANVSVIPVNSSDIDDGVVDALRQQLAKLQAELKERDIREIALKEAVAIAETSRLHLSGQPTISSQDRQQFVSPRPGVGEWVADVFMRLSLIEHMLQVRVKWRIVYIQ